MEISLFRALHAHGITGSLILAISGTAPGVLLCVWRRCVLRVFLRCLFAVGFRDCMIEGASVIIVIVIIGALSITLCSSSFATAGFNILVILGGPAQKMSFFFKWPQNIFSE